MVFHDKDKKLINSLFDFITCSHYGYNVTNYLNIAFSFLQMYGDKSKILPHGIVTDFSWAFINSVQEVFNKLEFVEYLDLCYDYLVKKFPLSSRIFVKSFLCWIHFFKNIIKKTKKFSKDKKVVISFNFFFNILQNCVWKNLKLIIDTLLL